MNAKEMLILISKPWCDINDLMKLTQLSRSTALKIKSKIKDELVERGYSLPTKYLPMNEVVSYLKINISYLQKMTKEMTERNVSLENYK